MLESRTNRRSKKKQQFMKFSVVNIITCTVQVSTFILITIVLSKNLSLKMPVGLYRLLAKPPSRSLCLQTNVAIANMVDQGRVKGN